MPQPEDAKINHRLREERNRRHWSQKELAEQLGTSVLTVKRWEHRKAQPGPYLRIKLTTLFNKSEQELGLLNSVQALEQLCTTEDVPSTNGRAFSSFPVTRAEEHREPLYWCVSYQRNPFFTGREAILQQVDQLLQYSDATTTRRYVALRGLGGVGKTQIALEYAYRSIQKFSIIFWVDAETNERLRASFNTIARMLGVVQQQEQEFSQVIARVQRWLITHQEWLVIFDNVEDLTLLKTVLPTLGSGGVLITTRRQDIGTMAQTIDIHPMNSEEGRLFLLRRAQLITLDALQSESQPRLEQPEELAAQTIVKMTDGLPLALDQAGAYIEATRCGIFPFLNILQSSQLSIFGQRDGDTDHPLSVITTFEISFEHIQMNNALAADLLIMCAFLSPDAIPEALLTEYAGLFSQSALQDTNNVLLQFNAAIKDILRYSLIQRQPQTRTLTIHRLVQAAIKQCISRDRQRIWMKQITHALNQAFPGQGETMEQWPWCEQLVPHIAYILSIGGVETNSLEFTSLLHKTALFLPSRTLPGCTDL
ncbi:XRE family transcriptional regulator [Dictyobacter arantiisoli]|uniref:HTH cro/C1-type domain-containing protein n=1 Tax=Dictyobacter arantiisoli TaxID=2014874 RepID=A0A5A5TL58_9CHLR|nr:XRE family transcriptional regulator [Dictyobacter arantiisoli]GCF11684.1 hypothetical protein KDI_52480 [Dictyobacter arantiisoli]